MRRVPPDDAVVATAARSPAPLVADTIADMSDTDFWVTPDGLDDQARAFDQCAELLSDAKSWVNNHPVGDSAQYPLYSGAAVCARDISAGLGPFLSHIHDVLIGAGVELRAVAQESRDMDMQAAAELDVLDPTEYNDFDPGEPGRRSAAEIAPQYDRTDELIFPVYSLNGGGIGYYCDASGMFDYINDREVQLIPGDLLSPSEWVWTVMGWLGAQSIKEDLLESFGGRWVDLYEFKRMLAGLGQMLSEVADNLEPAAGALKVYWQGYAANSAQEYFALLIGKLRDAGTELVDASDNFNSFLEGVEAEFDVLSGAAHGFIDAVIVAAVAASVGTVTAETVVGGVAGWSVAGLALLWASSRAKKVWDGVQELQTLLTILNAIDGLSADLSDVTATLHVPAMEASS